MGSAVLVLVECIINYHNQAKALAVAVLGLSICINVVTV
jgi:hypothetical protein